MDRGAGQNQRVPGARTWRGVTGLLSAFALGCACGKSSSQPPQPAVDTLAGETVGLRETGFDTEAADEGDAVLPVYTSEALAARFAAQRTFLGEDSLFEDREGNPLAPSLEPIPDDAAAPVGNVEDDMLLSLPGSSGYDLESAVGSAQAPTNGNALGLYVPIEHPASGPALAHFYDALRDLRDGRDEDGKVRVLVYGASHTQADVYPGYLRAYLQTRFGDGGMGFVSLTKVNRWFRYSDWSIDETKGWTAEHAQRSSARKDGLYGLLGASGFATSRRDRSTIKPRHDDALASRYQLFFLAQPDGGKLRLSVNGDKLATVDTAAASPSAGYFDFQLDEGSHAVTVQPRGNGEVRLFGLVMEREQPGVVVDTLGISGTRAANMLKWDKEVWFDNLRRRQPDLYTLVYGTNEATDDNQPISAYRADLREVLSRLREAAPEASCLVIGPGDFPREVEEDVWVPRPRLLEIVAAQRDVAYEMSCGFWDTLAFMGGVNSMHTWATSRPQMASRDHIHFTRRGYVRMGMAVTDAIMADFDRG